MPGAVRNKFRPWPQGRRAVARNAASVARMYAEGYSGCETDPRIVAAGNELFAEQISRAGGWPAGEDAGRLFGVEDFGADGLACNFLDVAALWPEAWPGPAQELGDCCSHAQKNADLATVATEIRRGRPDQVSGLIEGPPIVTPAGQRQGVFASEWPWWHRGYNGGGWTCSAAARTSTVSGVMVRRDYGDGLDLTRYSARNAGRYGRTPPPEKYEKIGRLHLIRTATRLSGWPQVRDFIAAGFGCTTCGGESFTSTRPAHPDDSAAAGPSKRTRGGWAHAMAAIAVDDRPATRRRFCGRDSAGGGLVLILNSWGPSWGRGPRAVFDSGNPAARIPAGSFWAKWSDVSRRSWYAMSSAAGWPPRRRHQINSKWG